MSVVEEIRPLVGAGAALLRATARLAEQGGRRAWEGSQPRHELVDHGRAGRRLADLLARAGQQSTSDAESAVLEALVDDLVPDEARIIAALAARGWSPLVHVEARRPDDVHLGLRNASLIGRQAGVALARLTPLYVTRLLERGLVRLTPARDGVADDYEVLLADPDVLDAVRAAGRGPLGARVVRNGIELSVLGQDLWACRRSETPA